MDLSPALNELGRQIVEEMRLTLERNRSNASGNLSRQIQYEVIGQDDNIGLSITFPEYGEVLDSGRGKSNRGGPNQQWRDKIVAWMRAKGISPRQGMSVETVAFLITRKINREGYKAKPWIESSIRTVLSQDLDKIFGPEITKQLNEIFPPDLFK
jgi:hypothetical protein